MCVITCTMRKLSESYKTHLLSKSKKELRRRYKYNCRNRLKIVREQEIDTTNCLPNFSEKGILAPSDFRVLENTIEVLRFFKSIRTESYWMTAKNGKKFISVDLREVTLLDYAAISIFSSIIDDLKLKDVLFRSNFPLDSGCKKLLEDSGFISQMYNEKGQKYPPSPISELIIFEQWCEKLSDADNRRLGEIVKKVVGKLTGTARHLQPIRTVLLEICGNSIEHAYTHNKHWLLGVQYLDDKVLFTLTDVGKGILKTLNKKFKYKITDAFISDLTVLKSVFDRKYGSQTKEINRNRGLPAIKDRADKNAIENLIVLTNNVLLHFKDSEKSITIPNGNPWFRGTFYQWELTKDSIEKILTYGS